MAENIDCQQMRYILIENVTNVCYTMSIDIVSFYMFNK